VLVRSVAIWVGLLAAASLAAAGEVKFSSKPAAAKAGGKVKISFSVSARTDVEVAVLGAKGEVIRHLAAGVLGGKKAPPAPLKAGLSQLLEWDMRDDFGKPVKGGPFKVRVRAGLGARFGRLIGGDPYTFGSIAGIAADEDGNVYIMGFGGRLNQRHMAIRVFDPEGRYLREILPFPANLKPGDMKDVARWDAERETFRPRNVTNLNPNFYRGGRGGRLTLVSASKKNGVILTDGTRIFTLETSGAVRGPKFVTRVMWEKKHIPWGGVPNSGHGPVCIAISPDAKHVYEAGLFTAKTKYGHKMKPFFPPGRVFRMKLAGSDFMKEFLTVKVTHTGGVGGNWVKGMGYGFRPRGPVHGIAVDGSGKLYVCDREFERIAVYDESGKLVNELPVEYADQVAVHPKTGAVYVIQKDRKSYSEWFTQLVKFNKLGKGEKPAATHKFDRKTSNPRMALSAGKDKTTVWVAGVKGGLVALEDKGASFAPAKTHFAPAPGVQLDWNRLSMDYGRDEFYVSDGATRVWRYDGKTGKGEILKRGGKVFFINDLSVGYDGNLYVRVSGPTGTHETYSGAFWRMTRDLKPAPFAGSGSHVLSNYIYSRYGIGYAERGIGPRPDGGAYVSFMYKWVNYCVSGFGPDGKALQGKYLVGKVGGKGPKGMGDYPPELKSAIIGPISAANGGLRVDLAGNIYMGMWAWPKGQPLPEGFEKDRGFLCTVGSVFKFTPEGGFLSAPKGWGGSDGVIKVPKTEGARGIEIRSGMRGNGTYPGFMEGAVAVYPGFAPFSHDGFGGNSCCVCRVPRFGLDRYGRLALPNAVTNSVKVVDNAGNLIAEIGRYGNFDSQYLPPHSTDKKPPLAKPEIPLTWPTGAGFGPTSLYINDTYSRRVVRADLTHAAEALSAVK